MIGDPDFMRGTFKNRIKCKIGFYVRAYRNDVTRGIAAEMRGSGNQPGFKHKVIGTEQVPENMFRI